MHFTDTFLMRCHITFEDLFCYVPYNVLIGVLSSTPSESVQYLSAFVALTKDSGVFIGLLPLK